MQSIIPSACFNLSFNADVFEVEVKVNGLTVAKPKPFVTIPERDKISVGFFFIPRGTNSCFTRIVSLIVSLCVGDVA